MENAQYLGVYSSQKGNKQDVFVKEYFLAWHLQNTYSVLQIDTGFKPVGLEKTLFKDEFVKNYVAEKQLTRELEEKRRQKRPAPPPKKSLNDFWKQAEKVTESPPREPEEQPSEENLNLDDKGLKSDAEKEQPDEALVQAVEESLRRDLEKYIKRSKYEKNRAHALESLRQRLTDTADIVPVHKHLLTEFGITLRKKSLPEMATVCFERVLELAPEDDHALFNFARIQCEQKNFEEAKKAITTAITLDQGEKYYNLMNKHIDANMEKPLVRKAKV